MGIDQVMVILRLHPEVSLDALARVRGVRGLNLARSEDPPALWLGGEVEDRRDLQLLRTLPAEGIYQAREPDDCSGGSREGEATMSSAAKILVPLGKTLPVERLPEDLIWKPLRECLELRLPTAAMAGQLEGRHAEVKLVRNGEAVRAPNLWLTSLEELHAYMDTASSVKFAGLRFAVSGDGKALLLGGPMLPLPGSGYHFEEGLALPSGWALSVPLSGQMARRWLGLSAAEIAVMHDDGTFDRLTGDDFLPLTRSAVRLTWGRVRGTPVLQGEDQ